jgi:uncharacterized protein YbjT (DUF2867 family)
VGQAELDGEYISIGAHRKEWNMKILITGATGTVGGHLARQVTGQGHEVVALVRDASRAKGKLPAEVGLIEGDLTSPGDVRRAVEGVDRAFLNMADDNGAAFAAAAGQAGTGGVALLSSFSTVVPLVHGDGNIVTGRHRAGEKALTEAGVPAAFLRAAGFDYNILLWAGQARDGVVRAPYPDVKLPIVDPADIAASAAAVLLAEPPLTGAFSITGPEKLSNRDQAAVLSELLGKPLTVEQISEADAAKLAFPDGTPGIVTSSVLGTMSPAASALEVSGDVEKLTGHGPRTFADWAKENVEAFR